MKYLLLIIAMLTSIELQAQTFSEGYRVGQLTEFSVKGLLTKSGEGQMLMGRESTPYFKTTKDSEGNVTRKRVNPWHFSAEKHHHSSLQNLTGEYVWIQYSQAHFNTGFSYDTSYLVKAVNKIDRTPLKQGVKVKNTPQGSFSKGKRVGRIVKASKKGRLSKTYEITIQVGNAGNQFKHMSISDEHVFKYAVECLKRMLIRYTHMFKLVTSINI